MKTTSIAFCLGIALTLTTLSCNDQEMNKENAEETMVTRQEAGLSLVQ